MALRTEPQRTASHIPGPAPVPRKRELLENRPHRESAPAPLPAPPTLLAIILHWSGDYPLPPANASTLQISPSPLTYWPVRMDSMG